MHRHLDVTQVDEWFDTQGTCIKTVSLYALCIVAFSSLMEGLKNSL